MTQLIRTTREFQAFTTTHLGETGSWLDTDIRVELVDTDGGRPFGFDDEPGSLRLQFKQHRTPTDGTPGTIVTTLAVVELGTILDAAGRPTVPSTPGSEEA